jgi:hypothetical protein
MLRGVPIFPIVVSFIIMCGPTESTSTLSLLHLRKTATSVGCVFWLESNNRPRNFDRLLVFAPTNVSITVNNNIHMFIILYSIISLKSFLVNGTTVRTDRTTSTLLIKQSLR